MRTVTRKQLVKLGLTKYQAEKVTKKVRVVNKVKRENVYLYEELAAECRRLLKTKLSKKTREAIEKIREELSRSVKKLEQGQFELSDIERVEYLKKQLKQFKKENRHLSLV